MASTQIMQADGDFWKRKEKKLRSQAKAIQTATFAIADALAEIATVSPASKLQAYLVRELGLFGADAASYIALAKLPAAERSALRLIAMPFSSLKTLIRQPEVVRAKAAETISAGTVLGSREIRDLTRDERTPAELELKRQAAYLRKTARRRTDLSLSTFREDYASFADDLLELHMQYFDPEDAPSTDEGHESVDSRLAGLSGIAARAVGDFRAIFDADTLPEIWDNDCYTGLTDEARLARAHVALADMAKGVFEPWTADPDDVRPCGIFSGLIDSYYVDAVLWLCGKSYPWGTSRPPRATDVAAPHRNPQHRLSSIELCAGAGGAALGLHAAGFDALALFEADKHAAETLRRNDFLGEVLEADITKVDFSRYKGIDLIAGGLPCQSFSSAGDRLGRNDERDLFAAAVDIVDVVRPRAFYFENVEGFKEALHTDYRAELHDRYRQLGYESRLFTIKGSDFGLPQMRERIAFVGFRDGSLRRFQLPRALPQMRVSMGAALVDLVAANGWPHAQAWAKRMDRMIYTLTGGSKKSGATSFFSHNEKAQFGPLQIIPNKIAKFAPDRDHPADAPFALTHAMAARLQGFPDDWKFTGSTQHRKRQIANALPPVMARVVGLALYAALTGVTIDFESELATPMKRSSSNATWKKTRTLNSTGKRYHESQAHLAIRDEQEDERVMNPA